jgi:hypothetical protein
VKLLKKKINMEQNTSIRVKSSFSIENLLSKPNKICHVKPFGNVATVAGHGEMNSVNLNNNNNVMFASRESQDCFPQKLETYDYSPGKQFPAEANEPAADMRENFTSPDSSCAEENMDTISEIASEGSTNSKLET